MIWRGLMKTWTEHVGTQIQVWSCDDVCVCGVRTCIHLSSCGHRQVHSSHSTRHHIHPVFLFESDTQHQATYQWWCQSTDPSSSAPASIDTSNTDCKNSFILLLSECLIVFEHKKSNKKKRKVHWRAKARKVEKPWKHRNMETNHHPPTPNYSPASNGPRTWQVCTWAQRLACNSICEASRSSAYPRRPSSWFPDPPPARRTRLTEGRVLLWEEPRSRWVQIRTQHTGESCTLRLFKILLVFSGQQIRNCKLTSNSFNDFFKKNLEC